jgi:hypothetical protein
VSAIFSGDTDDDSGSAKSKLEKSFMASFRVLKPAELIKPG